MIVYKVVKSSGAISSALFNISAASDEKIYR